MIYLCLQGEPVCWVKCSRTGTMGMWGSSSLQPAPQIRSPSPRPLGRHDVKEGLEQFVFFFKAYKRDNSYKGIFKRLVGNLSFWVYPSSKWNDWQLVPVPYHFAQLSIGFTRWFWLCDLSFPWEEGQQALLQDYEVSLRVLYTSFYEILWENHSFRVLGQTIVCLAWRTLLLWDHENHEHLALFYLATRKLDAKD